MQVVGGKNVFGCILKMTLTGLSERLTMEHESGPGTKGDNHQCFHKTKRMELSSLKICKQVLWEEI